ncbi:MAG: RluA family pseudouridine synthase [Alphaproteobacteria bacterium]
MSGVEIREVKADEAELRLDRWFRRHYPGLGHGRLEKLLRTGQVRIDGARAKAGVRLAAGQRIRIPPLDAASERPAQPAAPPVTAADTKWLRASVLHRDDEIIAIDKPPGLAAQGGSGTRRHLDAMLDALRFGAPERPRLVHRLDRDTSGVLLLARSAAAAARLGKLFRGRDVYKLYWALVVGCPPENEGRVSLALAKRPMRGGERVAAGEGKPAVTDYRVIDTVGRKASWLALTPRTGRTHQLRAHCAALGTPIVGDGKYGGAAAFLKGGTVAAKLHLHARAVDLPAPSGGRLCIVAPLPAHMRETWAALGLDPEAGGAPFAAPEGAGTP